MKKLLRTLAWCKIPFTYGIAIENDDRKRHRLKSDAVHSVRFNGMISSIQMFIALITVSFAITLSVYLTVRFDGTINLLALILYMFVGLIVIMVFNIQRDRVLVPTPTTAEGGGGEEEGQRDNLTLIGITIFYVLGCLLDMFHTITSISCDGVWRICNDSYIYVSYVTEIIFHILRIAYLGGETMFCISFNRSTFTDKPSTRYGLMFLLAANISLWFDALVHESARMFSEHPRVSRFSQRCLANNMNVSVDVLDCVYHNNTLYHMAKTYISPTFLPFTIEFTLLAGECLCHWFFHCAASNVVLASDTRGSSTDGGVAEDDVDDIHEDQKPVESPTEFGVEDDEDSFDSFSDSEEETRPLLEDTHQTNRSFKSVFPLVLIILLNVLLGVLAILPRLPGLPGIQKYRNLFCSYLFVFWLCMTASMAVGYHVSRCFRYDRKAKFGGLDYLLLFSSVGSLAFDVFTLIAISGQQQHDHQQNPNVTMPTVNDTSASMWLMLSLELCNAVETYLQVSFSLFAGRTILSQTDRTSKASVFRWLVLFLAVANGSLWLVGTFNAFHSLQNIQMDYFGANGWAIINNVFTPLSLFFRFNSCILFTRLYMRFRRNNEALSNATAMR